MHIENLLMTINAGSSTIKIGLFEIVYNRPKRISRCQIDFHTTPARFRMQSETGVIGTTMRAEIRDDLHAVIDETLTLLAEHFTMEALAVVGHRVVHGGEAFIHPVALDETTISAIADLTSLAPLHQPQALRLIRAMGHLRPHLQQSASFDTAFHSTQSDLVRRIALPREYHDRGIKRFGFHGLSYRFIASELARVAPDLASKKVVVAHLGSGASLCALEAGVSRDCSMGFSTLDGIPMATRPGAIDAGVLLHMLGALKMPLPEVEDLLYHKSGLLGVSGISGDTRILLDEARTEARQAIDLFALRIAGETGRMSATLGGLDAIVFTAGIGEHQPQIRAAVANRLEWLGLNINHAANGVNAQVISAIDSRITALVIPTNEEQVIAEEALSIHRKTFAP
jgi:acetate kinase